jgi:putative Holliday junction resolvase
MRTLAIDFGARRLGLAITDASGTLARPLDTLVVAGAADAIEQVVRVVGRLTDEEDGLHAIVVGMPRRLDGTLSPAAAGVTAFVAALEGRVALPIATEDERLTSREAESRLAQRERDWRKRKARLDAAAAAIILQDFLDRRRD